MATTISPMTVGDLADALELWGQTDGVGLNESDTPDQLKLYLERNPGLSLVVRAGNRIVGAVLCGHDGRRGYSTRNLFGGLTAFVPMVSKLFGQEGVQSNGK